MPKILHIEGELDHDQLVKSVQRLIDRHDIFRTRFKILESELIQEILDFQIDIPLIECSSDEIEKIKKSFFRPFDLSREPLIRIAHLKSTKKSHHLLIDMHHIISDATSVQHFIKEFVLLYEDKQLPNLEIQYKDFAVWQDNQIKEGYFQQSKKYWIEKFNEHNLPLIDLPLDYNRDKVYTFEGSRVDFQITDELQRKCEALAKENQCTPFIVFLSAFYTFLFKLSGQTDFVIGIPVAGRNHPQLKNVLGMFVNTLAMRFQINPIETFHQLLKRLHKEWIHAFSLQDYPFQELVKELKIKREANRNPLFDVMFNLVNIEQQSIVFGGVKAAVEELQGYSSKFDINLEIFSVGKGYKISLEYNNKLFSSETAFRMGKLYLQLLEEMTSDSSKLLCQICVGHVSINHEKIEPLPLVHEIFDEVAIQFQDQLAVIGDQRNYTYAQLEKLSNQIANFLIKENIGLGSTVPLIMSRSPQLVAIILGILKTGAAYLPLDISYPIDRMKWIIKDVKPSLICVSNEFKTIFNDEKIEVVFGDDIAELVSGYSEDAPKIALENNISAYVIYTSGSTGNPKGVVLSHKALSNLILWKKKTVPTLCKVLQFSSTGFDAFFTEMFYAFSVAGTLCIPPDEVRLHPKLLKTYCLKHSIDLLLFPYSFFRNFAEAIKNDSHEILNSVKQIISTGEQLKITPAIKQVFSIFPNAFLENHYGPSETHVVTFKKYQMPIEQWPFWASIGHTIPGTQVYVLDSYLNPVPVGSYGELYLAGVCLADGYFGRSQLTAKAFLPDPFSSVPGARMYKSGDRGRMLSDGTLEYQERFDNQVKIRGYRVELGEIENVLQTFQGIQQVAVTYVAEGKPVSGIWAYYVSDQELTSEKMHEYLSRKLPDYMLPKQFVKMTQMPITINGKIDTRSLLREEIQKPLTLNLEPCNPIELQLRKIWSNVLSLEEKSISLSDGFLNLGGDSLKGMVVVSRIFEELQVKITFTDLLKYETIFHLAKLIESSEKINDKELAPSEYVREYLASNTQKRFYFLQQFEEGKATNYNMSLCLALEGEVDLKRLQTSMQQLLQRHEIFRSTFAHKEGKIYQVIHENIEFEVPLYDVNDEGCEKLISEFYHSFNLSQSPLIRIALVKTPSKLLMMIDMHHSVADGFSLEILMNELHLIYSGRSLPEVKFGYRDYCKWHQDYQNSSECKKDENYWLESFKSHPPACVNFPIDFRRQRIESFVGDHLSLEFPENVKQGLNLLAKKYRMTMFTLVLGMFIATLRRYVSDNEITVAAPVWGRSKNEFKRIVGPFINTILINSYVEANKSFSKLLESLQSTVLNALEHQNFPFDELVNRLGTHRENGHNPFFNVMFDYFHIDENLFQIGDCAISQFPFDKKSAKTELLLECREFENRLEFVLEYSSGLFSKDSMERFLKSFEMIVEQILKNDLINIDQIKLISHNDAKLNTKQNDSLSIESFSLPMLLESNARTYRSAIAVSDGSESWTYEQLNIEANLWASHFIEKGLKTGEFVIIAARRCCHSIGAILGVLKAGGAYIPIDLEDNPVDRIKTIQTLSKAQIVVTDDENYTQSNVAVISLKTTERKLNKNFSPVFVSDEFPAYMVFTSGTTGQPKGVIVSHGNLKSITRCWKEELKLGEFPIRILQSASMSFDVFSGDIARSLVSGGQLFICRKNEKLELEQLTQLLIENKISICEMTPLLAHALATYLSNENQLLSDLKVLLVGSDIFKTEYITSLKKMAPHAQIYNTYGLTEATIDTTFYPLQNFDKDTVIGNVPIGFPFRNSHIYILGTYFEEMPMGAIGEIYIGGEGVAQGYYKQPSLTAERFLPDPYFSGKRMYRTGDLGRFLADGSLELIGRQDNQVKISGQRIELGEIEAASLSLQEVEEATAIIGGEGTRANLVLFVKGSDLNPDILRQYLTKILPSYMVPHKIIVLEIMPLTTNGKIDRKALSRLIETELRTNRSSAQPETEIEKAVFKIWTDILNHSGFGIEDSFFNVGGTSMGMLELQNRLKSEFSITIQIGELFSNYSVKLISQLIEEKTNSVLPKDNHSLDEMLKKLSEGEVSVEEVQNFISSQ